MPQADERERWDSFNQNQSVDERHAQLITGHPGEHLEKVTPDLGGRQSSKVLIPPNSMINSSGPFELAHNIGARGGYLGTLGASSGVRNSTLELPMQIQVEDPSEAARGTYASGNEIEDEIARLRRENELLK